MFKWLFLMVVALQGCASNQQSPKPITADQALGLDHGPGPGPEDATTLPMPLPEGRYTLINVEMAGRPWVRLIMDDGQHEKMKFSCAAQLPEGCASVYCAVIDREFCFLERSRDAELERIRKALGVGSSSRRPEDATQVPKSR